MVGDHGTGMVASEGSGLGLPGESTGGPQTEVSRRTESPNNRQHPESAS